MKKISLLNSLLLAGLVVFTLGSCHKDKESPTVQYYTPFVQDIHYPQGAFFKVEAYIDDDEGLKNYISYVTDSTETLTPYFVFSDTASVEGTGFIHRDSTMIPFGYPGKYYINIKAEDAVGNVTIQKMRFIVDP